MKKIVSQGIEDRISHWFVQFDINNLTCEEKIALPDSYQVHRFVQTVNHMLNQQTSSLAIENVCRRITFIVKQLIEKLPRPGEAPSDRINSFFSAVQVLIGTDDTNFPGINGMQLNLPFIDVLRLSKLAIIQGGSNLFIQKLVSKIKVTGVLIENCTATITTKNSDPQNKVVALKILLELLAQFPSVLYRMDPAAKAILFLYLKEPARLERVILTSIRELQELQKSSKELDERIGVTLNALESLILPAVITKFSAALKGDSSENGHSSHFPLKGIKQKAQALQHAVAARVNRRHPFSFLGEQAAITLDFFDPHQHISFYQLNEAALAQKPDSFFKENGNLLIYTFGNNHSTDTYSFLGVNGENAMLFCSFFYTAGNKNYRKHNRFEVVRGAYGLFRLNIPENCLGFSELNRLRDLSATDLKALNTAVFNLGIKPFIPIGLEPVAAEPIKGGLFDNFARIEKRLRNSKFDANDVDFLATAHFNAEQLQLLEVVFDRALQCPDIQENQLQAILQVFERHHSVYQLTHFIEKIRDCD